MSASQRPTGSEVAAQGVWVSANPSVISKLGTKEVLFTTRNIGWGVDTHLYRTPEALTQRFPPWLGKCGRLVLKQGRGNGGNGVWRVDLTETHGRWVPMRLFVSSTRGPGMGHSRRPPWERS